MRIYGKGIISEEVIIREVIPLIKRRNIDSPIVICTYWSKYPPLKTGLETMEDARGEHFVPREQNRASISCDYVIDEDKSIYRIRNFRIVDKHM